MNKKTIAIIAIFAVALVISSACAYTTYYVVNNANLQVNNSNLTVNNTPAPQQTNEPTPTPTAAPPENSSNQAELFYVYELFLKPGLSVDNLTVDTIPGYHSSSFYAYQADDKSGWLQIGFDSPVTSSVQADIAAICDSRGFQTYTWYIPLSTVNYYNSLRGRPIVVSSGLPAYGEAIKW